jgi:SlyX protein
MTWRKQPEAAMSDHITALEEQVAHLTRVSEELSDVVARQDKELELVKRRLQMIMEREAQRELDAGSSVAMTDERPPHY